MPCFFISVGQYYWFDRDCTGTVLYYHRDFYCIQIHDKEDRENDYPERKIR